MNLQEDILAKKYAKAFINLYGNALNLELVERLEIVADYLKRQHEALFYVQLSDLDNALTKGNFKAMLKSFDIDELFEPLIDLLLKDRRITLLPGVIHHVCGLYLEKNNIMHFIVESPLVLHTDEMTILRSYLAEKTGKNILFTVKKNAQLIAGLRVYSDTYGFEHSIRKQLRAIGTFK